MFGFIKKILQTNLFASGKTYYAVGPNNLNELLKQFDQPPKQKTPEEIIQKYCIQVAMYQYELEMLRMEVSNHYMGSIRVNNNNGTVDIDFVPCVVRPDVVYCSYGKN